MSLLAEWQVASAEETRRAAPTGDQLALLPEWDAIPDDGARIERFRGSEPEDPAAGIAEWEVAPSFAERESRPEPVRSEEDERALLAEWDPAIPPEILPDHDTSEPLESGTFALGGWAVTAGHPAVSAVNFSRRQAHSPRAEDVKLHVDALENADPAGLVVLSDSGFDPDRSGFTLVLGARDHGNFAAAGRYELARSSEDLATSEHAPHSGGGGHRR